MTVAMPPMKAHTRALPLRVGTRGSPLALIQTRGFLEVLTQLLPGAAQHERVRGTCHPHHRRRGAGPPPGGDRRQGPVRQGDPRGARRPPHRFRGAQPEGPGDRAAARHRARLHAEARGRARRADPRCGGCADRSRRPVRLPACRRGNRDLLGPPPGAVAARSAGPRHRHAPRQCADTARQAGRAATAPPRCWPMPA